MKHASSRRKRLAQGVVLGTGLMEEAAATQTVKVPERIAAMKNIRMPISSPVVNLVSPECVRKWRVQYQGYWVFAHKDKIVGRAENFDDALSQAKGYMAHQGLPRQQLIPFHFD